MSTSKFKLYTVVVYVFILLSFYHKGFCQTIIDLDKINEIVMKEIKIDKPILDSIQTVNDLIKIRYRSNIPYISSSTEKIQIPIISKGLVVLNSDSSSKIFDLKTANEVFNKNKINQKLYRIFVIEKKIQTQSLLGISYDLIHYLVSIDVSSGDTLWKKQANYLSIHQANRLSHVSINNNDKFDDLIIDNETGKELYRLIYTKPINVSRIIDDGVFLYFLLLGNNGELVAVNKNENKVVWKIIGEFNNVFIDENKIYTSNQYAIDKKTGSVIWHQNMGIHIVGIIGNYLVGYRFGENDLEMFVFNKNTGKPAGYIWSDDDFCVQCFGYQTCIPEFLFAEQSDENKTVAIIRCSNGVYLCVFETSR